MSSLSSSSLGKLVLLIKQEGQCDNFVETGTYLGDTAKWASDHFTRVVSIELSKQLFELTSERYSALRNLELYHGDSRTILGPVVTTLKGSSVFWLDGHYSCGNTAGEEHECPVLEELRCLKSLGAHDVILIDDAHMFVTPAPPPHKPEHWPSITEIIDELKNINHSFYIMIVENVIVAVPSSMKPRLIDYMRSQTGREPDADKQGQHPSSNDVPQAASSTIKKVSRLLRFLREKVFGGVRRSSFDPVSTLAALSSQASKLPIKSIQCFNQEERDIWVSLKAKTVHRNAKVLDVGAGPCRYRSNFAHCDYQTHDFKEYEGYQDNREGKYGEIDYVSDITAIPVPDDSFDVILCTEVLEHVPEPIAALQEMARILKPGGRLFITAPLCSGLHQAPYHYYGGYTPYWYRHFCPKFGLSVVEVLSNGGFFKLLAQECARVAWTMPQHEHVHGNNKESVGTVFGEVLPRFLFALEEQCMIDQFTVGYHVEAKKVTLPR